MTTANRKIDIFTMGIPSEALRRLKNDLSEMPGLFIECRAYDLFRTSDLISARLRIAACRADIVMFYWDIMARPAKFKMDLIFPLFGHMGLQYALFSRLKVPLIVLPHNTASYFLHADIVAYARAGQRDAFLAESLEEAKERIRSICLPPVLAEKKVCVFGKPFKSSTIRGFKLTEQRIRRKTEVSVEHRSLRGLVSGAAAISDKRARDEADRWISEADTVEGAKDQQIMESAKLYLFLSDLIEKENYHGIAVSCVSKHFPENPVIPFPCLAFSRLRDRGISAVCEADICTLVTSLLMENVAQKPSFMGNVAFVDTDAGTVTLTHCVSALRMEGYDRPPMQYSLQDYHDTGRGAVPSVDFAVDQPVTLGLLSKDLQYFSLWPGTLAETGRDFCANMARIYIPDPKTFKQTITGCHYLMVYGDIIKPLQEILIRLNIIPLTPTADN